MSKMHFSNSKKFKGKYLAAAACLVALGAAAWFGVGQAAFSPQPEKPQNTADGGTSSLSSQPQYTLPQSSEDAQRPSSTPSPHRDEDTPSSSSQQDAVQTVSPTADFFVLPVTGEIIKDFSDTELQYSLTHKDWRLHPALDIKAPTGERINAAGDGTVIEIYDDPYYGKTVVINHGNDIVAYYCGLGEVTTAVGDGIGANMQIGTLGKVPCESVETAHLHLVIKKGDKYISPLNIMGV